MKNNDDFYRLIFLKIKLLVGILMWSRTSSCDVEKRSTESVDCDSFLSLFDVDQCAELGD